MGQKRESNGISLQDKTVYLNTYGFRAIYISEQARNTKKLVVCFKKKTTECCHWYLKINQVKFVIPRQ